MIRYILFKNL